MPALDLAEAVSGFSTRPMSWTATMRSTSISPVAGSTATCAIWQPNVLTRMPSGFGPREPVPTSCARPSLPVTSPSGLRSAPSRLTISPPTRSRSSAETSKRSDARIEHLAAHVVRGRAHGRRHRWSRLRTAGDRGVDAVAGRPRLDANAVERQAELLGRHLREHGRDARADVLRSRDDRREAIGAEADERVCRRPAAAPPDLAGSRGPDGARPARLGCERVAIGPAGKLGRTVDRLLEALGGVGQPARLVEDSTPFRRRSSSGSISRASASSSIACSKPNDPSITPGARYALEKPRLRRTGNVEARMFVAAVERRRRHEHRRHEQPADAHRDHGGRLDRRQRAVAPRADP